MPLPHRLQSLGTRDGMHSSTIRSAPRRTPARGAGLLQGPAAGDPGRRLRSRAGLGRVRRADGGRPARAVIAMGRTARASTSTSPIACTTISCSPRPSEHGRRGPPGRAALDNDGVVLLSPGAPSFPRYPRLRRARHGASRSWPASTRSPSAASPARRRLSAVALHAGVVIYGSFRCLAVPGDPHRWFLRQPVASSPTALSPIAAPRAEQVQLDRRRQDLRRLPGLRRRHHPAPGSGAGAELDGVNDARSRQGQGHGRQQLRDPAGRRLRQGLRPANADEAGKAAGGMYADRAGAARPRRMPRLAAQGPAGRRRWTSAGSARSASASAARSCWKWPVTARGSPASPPSTATCPPRCRRAQGLKAPRAGDERRRRHLHVGRSDRRFPARNERGRRRLAVRQFWGRGALLRRAG